MSRWAALGRLRPMKAVSVVLRFPDGSVVTGADAADALSNLGRLQWEPCSGRRMKDRLSDRAWTWSRTLLDPLDSDDEFLAALNASGMVRVERIPRKAT